MNDYEALHEPIIPVLRLLLQEVSVSSKAWVLDLASGNGNKLSLLKDTLGDVRILAPDSDQATLQGAGARLSTNSL